MIEEISETMSRVQMNQPEPIHLDSEAQLFLFQKVEEGKVDWLDVFLTSEGERYLDFEERITHCASRQAHISVLEKGFKIEIYMRLEPFYKEVIESIKKSPLNHGYSKERIEEERLSNLNKIERELGIESLKEEFKKNVGGYLPSGEYVSFKKGGIGLEQYKALMLPLYAKWAKEVEDQIKAFETTYYFQAESVLRAMEGASLQDNEQLDKYMEQRGSYSGHWNEIKQARDEIREKKGARCEALLNEEGIEVTEEKVKAYVLSEFSPDLKNMAGSTLLHEAIRNGQELVVDRLIQKGANPFLFDQNGRSPLKLALTATTNPLLNEFFVRKLLCYVQSRPVKEPEPRLSIAEISSSETFLFNLQAPFFEFPGLIDNNKKELEAHVELWKVFKQMKAHLDEAITKYLSQYNFVVYRLFGVPGKTKTRIMEVAELYEGLYEYLRKFRIEDYKQYYNHFNQERRNKNYLPSHLYEVLSKELFINLTYDTQLFDGPRVEKEVEERTKAQQEEIHRQKIELMKKENELRVNEITINELSQEVREKTRENERLERVVEKQGQEITQKDGTIREQCAIIGILQETVKKRDDTVDKQMEMLTSQGQIIKEERLEKIQLITEHKTETAKLNEEHKLEIARSNEERKIETEEHKNETAKSNEERTIETAKLTGQFEAKIAQSNEERTIETAKSNQERTIEVAELHKHYGALITRMFSIGKISRLEEMNKRDEPLEETKAKPEEDEEQDESSRTNYLYK